ncbi:MAG: hypothetical protein H6729_13775 [Deltaproteobacteria bacterium]|nr:hypothetical protein [Deltaproteobacteria bacterium]
MSYSLNFYLASLDHIQSSLSQSDSPWFKKAYPLWLEAGEMEENRRSRALWQEIVTSISEAARRCAADPSQSVTLQDDAALAIAAGIHANSKFIDAMNHSSRSGALFREQFLGRIGQQLELLTGRPLSGLVADSYPCWGYLGRAEVLGLISRPKPPLGLDEDREEWLRQFIGILETARRERSDVVTVYS